MPQGSGTTPHLFTVHGIMWLGRQDLIDRHLDRLTCRASGEHRLPHPGGERKRRRQRGADKHKGQPMAFTKSAVLLTDVRSNRLESRPVLSAERGWDSARSGSTRRTPRG